MSVHLAGKAFVVDGTLPAGPELAADLVERGARVLLVVPDEAAAEAAATSLGDNGLALAADLVTPDGLDTLGGSVPIVLGRLDGAVVRCAGAGATEAVTDLDDAAWRRAAVRLVEAPARVVRELAPQLEEGGAVVLVEPPPDGGATDVLLPALRALAHALDTSLGPAARVRVVAGDADRHTLLVELGGRPIRPIG